MNKQKICLEIQGIVATVAHFAPAINLEGIKTFDQIQAIGKRVAYDDALWESLPGNLFCDQPGFEKITLRNDLRKCLFG